MFSRAAQIEWRRARVMTMMSLHHPIPEIASELNVSVKTISRDVKLLQDRAAEQLRNHIEHRLPLEFEKCSAALAYVVREAQKIKDTADDDRLKLQALEVIGRTSASLMELQTNANLIDEAMIMSQQVREQEEESKRALERIREQQPPQPPQESWRL